MTHVSLWANWQYPIVNYTRHQYGAGAQNWMLAQHDNGWIYVANNKGLLEFDGMQWNTYPVRNVKLRAVAKGNDGLIYVGGIGECGYFTADELGGLSYHSLSDSVPFHIGVIRNILPDQQKVYMQADRYVFSIDHGKVRYADHEKQILCSAVFQQRLFLLSSLGMFVWDDNGLLPVTGTDYLGSLQVVAMVPYRDQLLLITRCNGIYAYDGTSVRKIRTLLYIITKKYTTLIIKKYTTVSP